MKTHFGGNLKMFFFKDKLCGSFFAKKPRLLHHAAKDVRRFSDHRLHSTPTHCTDVLQEKIYKSWRWRLTWIVLNDVLSYGGINVKLDELRASFQWSMNSAKQRSHLLSSKKLLKQSFLSNPGSFGQGCSAFIDSLQRLVICKYRSNHLWLHKCDVKTSQNSSFYMEIFASIVNLLQYLLCKKNKVQLKTDSIFF